MIVASGGGPDGFHPRGGSGGRVQRGAWPQRLAVARAVYGSPSLVVLDEPNSNLDGEGEQALAECIKQLAAWGTTIVIISHRPATLSVVQKLLVLNNGAVSAFGPRDDVLKQITRAVPAKTAAARPRSAPTAAGGAAGPASAAAEGAS